MKRLTSTSIPAAVGSYSPASQVGHLNFRLTVKPGKLISQIQLNGK